MNFSWRFLSFALLVLALSTDKVLTLPADDSTEVGYRERQVEEFLKLIANQQGNRDNSNSTRYDHCTGESVDCPQDEVCCCMEFVGVNYGCTCFYQYLLPYFPLATCDLDFIEESGGGGGGVGGGGWSNGWKQDTAAEKSSSMIDKPN